VVSAVEHRIARLFAFVYGVISNAPFRFHIAKPACSVVTPLIGGSVAGAGVFGIRKSDCHHPQPKAI
jgi:hypothetical protein